MASTMESVRSARSSSPIRPTGSNSHNGSATSVATTVQTVYNGSETSILNYQLGHSYRDPSPAPASKQDAIFSTHGVYSIKEMPESMIAEMASKVDDTQSVSPEDLQRVFMDTLLAHNMPATMATLRGESAMASTVDFGADFEPLVPPGMPETVPRQYRKSREASARQQRFLEDECTQQVLVQRNRLQRLVEHFNSLRKELENPSEEQVRNSALLREQETKLEALRLSAQAHDRIRGGVAQDSEHLGREKYWLTKSIKEKTANMEQMKVKILQLAGQVEQSRRQAETCDAGRAQRIRHLLLTWDQPQGPRFIAAETFAHVDSNHDGRLEWNNDEICRFVRLLFHYHRVDVPTWPDSIWLELYRCCGLDQIRSVEMPDACKFARGCFEAALRALVGG